MGEVCVRDVDIKIIEAFRHKLARHKNRTGKPASISTQRTDYAALTRLLDSAVDHGLLENNPCRSVKRPSRKNTLSSRDSAPTRARAHSPEHVSLILDAAAGEQVEPLLRFVADTGCRIGEALALRWEDVDLAKAQARVVRSKTRAGERVVPLLPEVVQSLQAWRARQDGFKTQMGVGWANFDGLVFTTGVGTAIDSHNARRMLRLLVVRVNRGLPGDQQISVERPWHTLRHSLASTLLNRGVPMPVVSQILGHANIGTTVDIYGHAEPSLTAKAMAEALGRTDDSQETTSHS